MCSHRSECTGSYTFLPTKNPGMLSFSTISTGVNHGSKSMMPGMYRDSYEVFSTYKAKGHCKAMTCSSIAGRGANCSDLSGRCMALPTVALPRLEVSREWPGLQHWPCPIHTVKTAFTASRPLQSSKRWFSPGRDLCPSSSYCHYTNSPPRRRDDPEI